MKVLKGVLNVFRIIIVTIFKTIFTIISAIINFCFRTICFVVGIFFANLVRALFRM